MHKDLILLVPLALVVVALIGYHFASKVGDEVDRIEGESQNEKMEEYPR